MIYPSANMLNGTPEKDYIIKYNDKQSVEEIKNKEKFNKEEFEKMAIRLINNVMSFLLIKKNLY